MTSLEEKHKQRYEAVSADAGYESLTNYRFLDGAGIKSFIKPVSYEYAKGLLGNKLAKRLRGSLLKVKAAKGGTTCGNVAFCQRRDWAS
jgi:hypothetical protein